MENKDKYKEITDKQYLFAIYSNLLDENKRKPMFNFSYEQAFEEFDENYLEALITSEKMLQILKRHKDEIRREMEAIYPFDIEKRKLIQSFGEDHSIHVETAFNKIKVYQTGRQFISS